MKFLCLFLFFPALLFSQVNPVFVSKTNLSYTKVQSGSEGMFAFELGGKIGYMDKSGTIVVPAIYSYDSVSTYSISIPFFYNGYAKIIKERKCGMIDKSGKIIIPIEYENLTPFTQFGNFVLIMKTISGKKNYGVVTVQNKQLVPVEYEDIKMDTGMMTVKQNGKWGLIDKTGKQLLPCEYNYLSYSPTDKVATAEKGTQYGVVDLTGKWLFEKVKSIYTLYSCKFGMVQCKVSGKYGYLDLKGNEVVVTRYEGANDFNSYGLALVYKKKEGTSYTNIYGYIDKKGNEVIPLKYESIGTFNSGLVYAKDPETNRFGYMDKTGKWALPAVYIDGTAFDDFGGAWVKMTDDKYHYINKTGKDLGTFNEKGNPYQQFGKDGYAVYEDPGNKCAVIDRNGKQIKLIDDVETLYLSAETMTPYKSKATGKYGCVDVDGNKVIPAEYEGFAGFTDGVCKVQKTIDGKLKSGYIDAKNKTLVPLIYTTAGIFNDGWGIIKKDSLYLFIDRNGNLKEPARKYDNLNDFKSGFALGVIKGQNNNPSTYYYINKDLKEQFSVSFKEAYAFWDEVAIVKRDKAYELMNKKGEVFKSLGAVDFLKFSVDGMLAIRENKKWGYANSRGDIVISPRYDSCDVFKFGYAKVMKDKKWGIIDKAGNEIIEPKYENIIPGENGLFIYFDKFWGVMDKTGKVLVQPNYISINPFEKDRTVAKLGKSFMILKSPLAK